MIECHLAFSVWSYLIFDAQEALTVGVSDRANRLDPGEGTPQRSKHDVAVVDEWAFSATKATNEFLTQQVAISFFDCPLVLPPVT